MNARRFLILLYLLVAAGAALFTGCARSGVDRKMDVPNQPPVVTLTSAPFNDGSAYFYAYRINWSGYDPDGWVVKYQYAIDPPSNVMAADWVETTKNEQILFFTATRPDSSAPLTRAIDFHTFAIRAIDNDNDTSAVAMRSFFSFTVAPTVSILTPQPRAGVNIGLSPSVRISWTGTDPDGQLTAKPVSYRYLLLGPGSEFPLDVALTDPDSVRRYYAPEFRGWTRTPADTTEVQFTNLTPGQNFIFVVVGFDEAGAYSPIFDLNGNMLRFRVGFAGNLGPTITMFNSFFNFSYTSGGYSTDPSREVFIEVPAGQRIPFNWFARSVQGSDVASYRWALDIADVSDNTPRDDEETDTERWSAASINTQSATVGPFGGGEEHRFYIEAVDNNGLRSLGIVRFQVIESTFERKLLVVDDTRLIGDETAAGTGGCVRPPIGAWPTAAELDTFLFAKGGHPWRCYPAGTISPPGLFAGYPFDTTGTRTGSNEVVVRLARLGLYEHVVWVVDARSATFNRPGSDPAQPQTALRYMSGPGRFNALAAYIQQGGKVWLVGGGGGFASMIPWNSTNNDGGGITFSFAQGELIPGRFMYDLVGWRSEFKVATAGATFQRFLGRNTTGSWPGMPDYTKLPPNMRGRTQATDPFPPNRQGQSGSVYYKSLFDFEFMSLANFVLEDTDPDPDVLREESVLDTLYRVITFALPPQTADRVVMTYLHSPFVTPLLFTGFSIWDFTRADCQAMVDFVLQDIWGISRSVVTVPRMAPAAAIEPPGGPAPAVLRDAVARPLGGARPAFPGGTRAPSRE
jgi:hypothetical protein